MARVAPPAFKTPRGDAAVATPVGRRLRRMPEPPGCISADFLAALATQVDDLVANSTALAGLQKTVDVPSRPTSARGAKPKAWGEDRAEPDEEPFSSSPRPMGAQSPGPTRELSPREEPLPKQLLFPGAGEPQAPERPDWSKRGPERSATLVGYSLFSEREACNSSEEALLARQKGARSLSPVERGHAWKETLDHIERKREWLEVQVQLREREVLRENTGQPALTERSRRLVQDSYIRPWEQGARQRPLSSRGVKVQKMVEEKLAGEVKEETFRPELCQRSRDIFRYMNDFDEEWHTRVQRRRVVARNCSREAWQTEVPDESRPWITPMARRLQRSNALGKRNRQHPAIENASAPTVATADLELASASLPRRHPQGPESSQSGRAADAKADDGDESMTDTQSPQAEAAAVRELARGATLSGTPGKSREEESMSTSDLPLKPKPTDGPGAEPVPVVAPSLDISGGEQTDGTGRRCPPGIAALSNALRAHVLPRGHGSISRAGGNRSRTPPGSAEVQKREDEDATGRRRGGQILESAPPVSTHESGDETQLPEASSEPVAGPSPLPSDGRDARSPSGVSGMSITASAVSTTGAAVVPEGPQ